MTRVSCLSAIIVTVLLSNLGFAEDFFYERIAPVFAQHCLPCHNNRDPKGDFSLESAGPFFESESVVRGDVEGSHLVDLIESQGKSRALMPKTGASLTSTQVEDIKTWIENGADWPDGFELSHLPNDSTGWWSLRPLVRPVVPELVDEKLRGWVQNPIDAFVLKKMQVKGLKPTRRADATTLIRRLSYNLTGLPPTYEETVRFAQTGESDAYQNLVDRLLNSPRYGERWARHWLDVVKYADTCGYDKDKLRKNAWPYRDYVIRSFNTDKPYARFVQEQLAGDVLYPDDEDGILGLGFIAAGPWDFIGHVEVPETKVDGMVARNLDRDDMVSNTLNTFCSTTVQCARCHDHKFDPIKQHDYYAFQAIFAAVDRAERVYSLDKAIVAKEKSLKSQVDLHQAKLKDILGQIAIVNSPELLKVKEEIAKHEALADSMPGKRPEFGFHSQLAAEQATEKWVELSFDQPRILRQIILNPCHDDFAGIGAGFGFPVRFRIEFDGEVVWNQTRFDFKNPGIKPVNLPVHGKVRAVRIVATKLAERQHDFIFALAECQLLDNRGDNVASEAKVTSLDSIEAPVRWRKSNLVDGIWYESSSAKLETLQAKRIELVNKLAPELFEEQRKLEQQLEKLRSALKAIPNGKMVYAAATSFPSEGNFKPTEGEPRIIHFLNRGDVQSRGEVVKPALLELFEDQENGFDLNQLSTDAERRAKLARWLTHSNHPLTWRSVVNRVWHYHFGKGIVDTPNDFGRMGGLPSHPELLDWLACEFRDSGGSFKTLHKLIVSSATYQQASMDEDRVARARNETLDSGNRFMWRHQRRRLSAEEVRDTLLMTGGVLDLSMGGPGYFLFSLEKPEHSPHYEYHKFDHSNADSYRRSIYRFVVRSQPDPYMSTLDCADSSQSTPDRNETYTPLQALVMLNSDFNLAMAEKFAERLRQLSSDPSEQAQFAFQIGLGRAASVEEVDRLVSYTEKHGLENLARVIFNLSEFLFVD